MDIVVLDYNSTSVEIYRGIDEDYIEREYGGDVEEIFLPGLPERTAFGWKMILSAAGTGKSWMATSACTTARENPWGPLKEKAI